jgi:hypothetical protein
MWSANRTRLFRQRLGSVKIPLNPDPDISKFIRLGTAMRDISKYPRTSGTIAVDDSDAAALKAYR